MTTAKELFKPRYSGIIFDLDGTLINSLEDLVDACNQVMLHYGLELKSYQEGKKLIGRGLRNLIKRAVTPEMAKDEALVDEAVALMKAEYAKRYTHKTMAYDGIRDLLRYLHVHKIPFAVCTNKPDSAAKTIVDALFDISEFVDVVGQNDNKPRKPDPTQTLEVAAKMGVAPGTASIWGTALWTTRPLKTPECSRSSVPGASPTRKSSCSMTTPSGSRIPCALSTP